MLGNLEKGGDRRQQVRHDLLHHRHERAAPRQLHELVEGRLLHSLFLQGRRGRLPKRPAGRPLAGPDLELPFRLRDEHLEAADRRASRSRGARIKSVGSGSYTRSYTSRPSNGPSNGISPRIAALPTGVALTSRSHEPGGGGHAAASAPIACATHCARRPDAAPRSRPAPLRGAAPARRRARRRRRRGSPRARPTAPASACRSGSRKPSASVFMPTQRPSRIAIVFTAPAAAAVGATSSSERHHVALERNRDARAAQADASGELAEVVDVARLDRHVHGVQSERGETRVVHRRRQRVDDRPAEQRVHRGVGTDAPEPELLQQPRRRDLPGRDAVAGIGPARSEPPRQHARRQPGARPSRSGSTPRRAAPARAAARRSDARSTMTAASPLRRRSRAAVEQRRQRRAASLEVVARHDHAACRRARATNGFTVDVPLDVDELGAERLRRAGGCAAALPRRRRTCPLRGADGRSTIAGFRRPASAASASGDVIESRRSSTRSASASAAMRACRMASRVLPDDRDAESASSNKKSPLNRLIEGA